MSRVSWGRFGEEVPFYPTRAPGERSTGAPIERRKEKGGGAQGGSARVGFHGGEHEDGNKRKTGFMIFTGRGGKITSSEGGLTFLPGEVLHPHSPGG